jgi:hypothetical protein
MIYHKLKSIFFNYPLNEIHEFAITILESNKINKYNSTEI